MTQHLAATAVCVNKQSPLALHRPLLQSIYWRVSQALQLGVQINVDNFDELDRVEQARKTLEVNLPALFSVPHGLPSQNRPRPSIDPTRLSLLTLALT
jgi:hypothetical protein